MELISCHATEAEELRQDEGASNRPTRSRRVDSAINIAEGRQPRRRERVKVTAPCATGRHQFCLRLSGVDRAKCKHMSHNPCYFHTAVEVNCVTDRDGCFHSATEAFVRLLLIDQIGESASEEGGAPLVGFLELFPGKTSLPASDASYHLSLSRRGTALGGSSLLSRTEYSHLVFIQHRQHLLPKLV